MTGAARACVVAAALVVGWALLVVASGGVVVAAGPVRLSSHDARNPIAVVILLLVAAWVLTPKERRRDIWRHEWTLALATVSRLTDVPAARARRVAHGVAAALTLATVALGWWGGAHVAGGSDSYGYVSQADLWASGTLRVTQPLLDELPAGVPPEVLVPLGYRFDETRTSLVPVYAPGLPMQMAVSKAIAGARAVYAVMPLLAGVLVWATYRLGTMLLNPVTGVLAALLLATSPAFVMQLTHAPMSDIPAAAWWAMALILTFHASRTSALAAGLAASLAILTRPNLVPLALIPGGVLLWGLVRGRDNRAMARQRVVWFAVAALVSCVVVAALNDFWYGSPTASGYGALGGVFYRREHFWPNVVRYTRWIAGSQTPLVFVAFVAPVLLWRSRRERVPRVLLVACVAFAATIYASYAFYLPFEAWWFLRLLLPAYPVLFVFLAAGLILLCDRLTMPLPRVVPVVSVMALAAYGLHYGYEQGAFDATGERRYAAVGEFVATQTPPRAVVLAMLHSGSIRHYSGRQTLRFDLIPADRLDATLAHLRRLGRPPYLVIDDGEAAEYLARFSGRSEHGRLDWVPQAMVSGVRIFAPSPAAMGQRPAP